MVLFDPQFTEVIYFDTESYVPASDRKEVLGSMILNAAKRTHFFMGGVFRRAFPLQKKIEPAVHIWNWDQAKESETLSQVYSYFRESWKMIEGKTAKHTDLILIGTGISRSDIPTLFVRSMLHNVDSSEWLFETDYKTKIVDLGDVGIPLFNRNPDPVLYPKTTNALMARLGLRPTPQDAKTSGKTVWDLYDAGEFDLIKARTAQEVENVIEIAARIIPRP